jgi:outer membrane murein-binding lipoprotein Lpp
VNITRTKIAATIGAAVLATLMLSGCAGGQSKADACKSMESQVSKASSDIQAHASELASNPKEAASSIQKLATTFDDATKKVTQPDVKKAADKAAASLDDFAKQFNAYAADPAKADTSKISSSSTSLQSAFTALQKACTS